MGGKGVSLVGRVRRHRQAGVARGAVALLCASLALSSCQTLFEQAYVPTVGPSDNPQIVDQVQKDDPRAQMGAREHPRIVASYGGEYHDDRTEKLVARITGALTAVSENPNQSYRITILNSPAINAFALPGGYLYVTRGLLALANDASEVAAVLSHEMAHVTANHGIERQRREEAEVIASRVVAEVLSSDLAGKQALARGKLRLAAFSRQQELQADVIGVRTLGEAGYDPYAAARFLDSMASYSHFTSVDPDADQSLDFLSSHRTRRSASNWQGAMRAPSGRRARMANRAATTISRGSTACSTATARRRAMSAARHSCMGASASALTFPTASRSTTRSRRCLPPAPATWRSVSTAWPTPNAAACPTIFPAAG